MNNIDEKLEIISHVIIKSVVVISILIAGITANVYLISLIKMMLRGEV